ncbi:enoyl-CoA hydratase/isomerase family protein [Hydrogenophaga sp. RAC07]|uniref:enoyl-CoA hydratase/isomerase family protein n=1 Tax=Hydrogenophaga sp. RAC07 TaxID=1842537 RepID=UPI00083E1961|nr:enoyl-CoA hydratase/isomerase family protein [Hydrogenophaga sp. RAC07]AOF86845.1 enoyl-CoA hydratase/isomerase family protein [Hydrogenophaga sp. RAC07]
MTVPKLLIERHDGVLTLILNRPGKLNAIDNELAASLRLALDSAALDSSVRTIRLRGNGRAFCAGRDVSEAPTDRDLELVQAVARSIVQSPKPVVAVVHGWTVGAGLEWMLDADIVFAADDTRFKLPEASLGVFVTGGLVATLPAAVGLTRAKALMLLGDEFTAQQAEAWGLVYKTCSSPELEKASLDACKRLAALKPAVASQFKRVLNLFGLQEFNRAVAEEENVQRSLARGDA